MTLSVVSLSLWYFGHGEPQTPDVLIVLGGSKGLGHALIKSFQVYSPRTTIYAVSRNEPKNSRRIYGVHYVQADIVECSEWDLNAMFDALNDENSNVWIINCVGSARCAYFTQVQDIVEATEQMIDVNLIGTMHAAYTFLRYSPRTKYVMVASVLAHLRVPGYSIYGVGKSAMKAFYEFLCAEGLRQRVGILYANTMLTEGYKEEEAAGKPSVTKQLEKYDAPDEPDNVADRVTRRLIARGCCGELYSSWSAMLYCVRFFDYTIVRPIIYDLFTFYWSPVLVDVCLSIDKKNPRQ